MPVSVGIITVIVFIGGGAVLFSVWEGWNLFDGAYYSFITLSTIGFGVFICCFLHNVSLLKATLFLVKHWMMILKRSWLYVLFICSLEWL